MDYQNMLRLQKCLYFNYYIYLVWVPVTGFFLFIKITIALIVFRVLDVKKRNKSFKVTHFLHKYRTPLLRNFKNLTSQVDTLGHLTKYLSITVFTLLLVIEAVRIYLGHYGNLSSRVPELAGFLMLTVLMQMPLVSFFLFNPYLLNTPTEFILNLFLCLLTVCEVLFGFMALKQASDMAKSIYLSHASTMKT